MSAEDSTPHFRQNAYLATAHRAIWHAQRPLTPREMLKVAEQEGFLPKHLFGKTMHKTLSARLSEHIREASSASTFYRTAPSTFFSHDLANNPKIPDEYKKVFIGHLRSKSIRRENVLVVPKDYINEIIFGEFIPFHDIDFNKIYRERCTFVDRSKVENDETYKQFVTFTIVVHKNMILTYRRGKFTTTSDTLKGQLSVGFGGHINDDDFDLFNQGIDAFKNNASRELKEELFFDSLYQNRLESLSRTDVLGYINVETSPDARKHLAILTAFHHKDPSLPRKGELSINQLAWYDYESRQNDLSDFDLWSEIIIRNIRSGEIELPRGHLA